jgi:hypothetical protein
MPRRSLLAFLAFAAASFAHADWFDWIALSGSGVVKSEAREVGAFTGIALSIPALVEVRTGDRESVVVEADDNILPLVETVVEGGSLQIRSRDKVASLHAKTLKVSVTARKIESLAISGSGDIRAASLKGESLSAKISGSGDIRIATLDAGSLQVAISGSGDFTAGGKAESLQASIAGSGNLAAGSLDTRRAAIKIAGSGDAKVWVREALSVSVAGSGDVAYYGDPAISKSVAGSGTLKRLGAAPG